MPETVDPYPSKELRVAIYDYFRWLSAKKPPAGPKDDDTEGEDSSTQSPPGQKVLAALMEEFPDELEGRATEVPIPRLPELSLRYNAYDDHMKRLVLLQTRLAAFERQGSSSSTAVASVPDGRKRKDPPSTDERDVKQLKPSPDDSVLTAAGSVDSSNKGQKVYTWEERYDQLVEFEKGHGHCRVPKRWKENMGLARWVGNQRERYKGGKMEKQQDRIAKLLALGFEFVIKDKPTTPWEQRYEELKLFQREHGHTRVPRTSATHKVLGEWVHKQRGDYRRKAACMMETDRLTRLQEIGFEFKTGGSNSWDYRFEQLVEFRQTHGNIRVPPEEKVDGLGAWFQQQVEAYWKFKSGNKSTLTYPQFKKLDGMGFGEDTAAGL